MVLKLMLLLKGLTTETPVLQVEQQTHLREGVGSRFQSALEPLRDDP